MNLYGYKKNKNRGASLVAVLVVIAFVGIIGAVVASVTITNIQMKEVEQSGKKNFYSAEEIMDELTIGLNDIAAAAMQSSYTTVLSDYRNIMVAGEDIQEKFTKIYIDTLMNAFWDKDNATRKDLRKKYDDFNVENYIYVYGFYNVDILKSVMSAETKDYISAINNDDASFHADYVDGTLTLNNVKVTYEDAMGYETTISTDMVFHTPVLNFNGSNAVKDYMRCAILADGQLLINMSNISINGNVYAGAGGITTSDNGNAMIAGSKLVTRGDIIATSGSSLDIGKDAAEIWAENIGTEGNGLPAVLKMNGKIYVADDLKANAKNGTVILSGQYFGYNYLQDYDTSTPNVSGANYSSAMMINGRNSRIDLSGLNYLLLSGRTYISRGVDVNNSDIILGESVSVRTNQLAYYIPTQYVDVDTVMFKPEGLLAYADSIGIAEATLLSYLNAAKPIVPYYFQSNGTASTRYYLNFKDEASANQFFADYYQVNSYTTNAFAKQYADAIIIQLDNESLVYTLKGDVMYQSAEAANLGVKNVTIAGDPSWDPDGAYWKLSDRLATTYMSNQMYLEDMHTGISSGNVRFAGDDKTIDPLFDNVINRSLIQSDLVQQTVGGTPQIAVKEEKTLLPGSTTQYQLLAVVNNSMENSPAFEIGSECVSGIVIATGDVVVRGNFKGMIWAGGTIRFANSNLTISADEVYVSNLFAADIARLTNGSGQSPVFATYFKDYNLLAESVIGEIQIDQYLTYQNWKKNEE
ncbi:MAG: hypothetical protein ACI4F0_01335 [Agathobacter sp.]